MKKILINGLLGVFLAVLYATTNGQTSLAGVTSIDAISSQTEPVSKEHHASNERNERGGNVLRNFEGKVSNVSWYESSFGFVTKFNFKGIDYRVDLDKKGNWLETIRSYEEIELPVDVDKLIRNSYNGYSISLVQEIERPFRPLTFVVNLEGKDDVVQVRISGGEIEEWRQFSKTHSDSFTSDKRN